MTIEFNPKTKIFYFNLTDSNNNRHPNTIPFDRIVVCENDMYLKQIANDVITGPKRELAKEKCNELAENFKKFNELHDMIKTLLTKHNEEQILPQNKVVLTGGRMRKSIKKKKNKKKLTYKLYGGNNDILKQLKPFIDRNISMKPIIHYYYDTIDKNDTNIFENMKQRYNSIDDKIFQKIQDLYTKLWKTALTEQIISTTDVSDYPRKIQYILKHEDLEKTTNLLNNELQDILDEKYTLLKQEDSISIKMITDGLLSDTHINNSTSDDRILEIITNIVQIGNILKNTKSESESDKSVLQFRLKLHEKTEDAVNFIISNKKDQIRSRIMASKLGVILKQDLYGDIKSLERLLR